MNTPALPAIDCTVTSQPYPVECIEGLTLSLVLSSARFGGIRIRPEAVSLNLALTGGTLTGITFREYDNYAPEAVSLNLTLTGGLLRNALVSYPNYAPEAVSLNLTLTGGLLKNALISYPNYTPEALNISLTLTSGTLT